MFWSFFIKQISLMRVHKRFWLVLMFIVIILMRHALIGRTKDRAGIGTGPVYAHIDRLQNSPFIMAHTLNDEPDRRVKYLPVVTTSQEKNQNYTFWGVRPCGLLWFEQKTQTKKLTFKLQIFKKMWFAADDSFKIMYQKSSGRKTVNRMDQPANLPSALAPSTNLCRQLCFSGDVHTAYTISNNKQLPSSTRVLNLTITALITHEWSKAC